MFLRVYEDSEHEKARKGTTNFSYTQILSDNFYKIELFCSAKDSCPIKNYRLIVIGWRFAETINGSPCRGPPFTVLYCGVEYTDMFHNTTNYCLIVKLSNDNF